MRKNITNYLDFGLIIVAFLLGIYLNWEWFNIAILCFIVWNIVRPLPSAVLFQLSLVFMVCIPLASIVQRESRAEEVLQLAGITLLIAVLVKLTEGRRR